MDEIQQQIDNPREAHEEHEEHEEHLEHNEHEEHEEHGESSQLFDQNTTETDQQTPDQKAINKNHKDMIDELHYKFRIRKRKTVFGQQTKTEQPGTGSNGQTNFRLNLVDKCSFWALVIAAIIIILNFIYCLANHVNVS